MHSLDRRCWCFFEIFDFWYAIHASKSILINGIFVNLIVIVSSFVYNKNSEFKTFCLISKSQTEHIQITLSVHSSCWVVLIKDQLSSNHSIKIFKKFQSKPHKICLPFLKSKQKRKGKNEQKKTTQIQYSASNFRTHPLHIVNRICDEEYFCLIIMSFV